MFEIRHPQETAIVFHHIPKCGGTSLNAMFYKWFSVIYDYDDQFATAEDYLKMPVNDRLLSAGVLLAGHWNFPGSHLHERYPRLLSRRNRFLFTFLRDPLGIRCSLYRYERKRADPTLLANRLSMEEFLFAQHNHLATQFPCDLSNYRSVVDRYDFIGFIETFKPSISLLLERLAAQLRLAPKTSMTLRLLHLLAHRKLVETKALNQTAADGGPDTIPDEWRRKFREQNTLDYSIYDYAWGKFAPEAAAAPPASGITSQRDAT